MLVQGSLFTLTLVSFIGGAGGACVNANEERDWMTCREAVAETEVELFQTDYNIKKQLHKLAASAAAPRQVDASSGDVPWKHHTKSSRHDASADKAKVAAIRTREAQKEIPEEEPVLEPTTTLDPLGLTLNAAGDLSIFMTGIVMYGFGTIVIFLGYSFIWHLFPLTYYHNVTLGIAPPLTKHGDDESAGEEFLRKSAFSWIKASLRVRVDDVIETAGLDAAMMLELSHIGMKIMGTIGLPMFFIMGPMNLIFGGNAAGEDHLSYLSFGNVEKGNWLYSVYPLVVWYVVIVVQYYCWHGMRRFVERRFRWMETTDEAWATTVLVEGIPLEGDEDEGPLQQRTAGTEQDLRQLFMDLGAGRPWVKNVHFVLDTTTTDRLLKELQGFQREVALMQNEWEKQGKDAAKRPLTKDDDGQLVDGITHYERKAAETKKLLKQEQSKAIQASKEKGNSVNMTRAFVRFDSRLSAEMVLRMSGEISADAGEWNICRPPQPSDINWSDLTQDPEAELGREVLGYVLTAALFFLYLPLVLGIQRLANALNFGGMIDTIWQLVAPTIGTMIVVAFLPTVLLLIFKYCFTLHADQFAQHKLQKWYFWFQMFFLVFIAAVGRNFMEFTKSFAESPFSIFTTLADTLPFSTHFFMNYFTLTYVVKAMQLTRHVPLMKYLLASKVWSPEEAKKMSEPEDQDYYGTGGRMSRWTIFLCIGIIYGTMSPPICILAFILFAEIRLAYGYLLPFAETYKPSLGGEFWVTALTHIQLGNLFYAVVMAGILYRRAASSWPMICTVPTIAIIVITMVRAQRRFQWRSLPLERVCNPGAKPAKTDSGIPYRQPSLDPELCS